MQKKLLLIAAFGLSLALMGCSLPGLGGEPTVEVPTATLTPGVAGPTPVTLAPTLRSFNTLQPPTLTPSPTGQASAEQSAGGPTPLPAPTQIGQATPTPVVSENSTPSAEEPEAPNVNVATGPGISINPQLGEPRDVVTVKGNGFAPGEKVTLHWGSPDGDTGPEYWSLEADANGNFEVGLIVLPAERWPGGAPKEGDYIQLRAVAPSLDFNYFWANFRYIKRFNPGTSLALTFTNTDWDYEIDVPTGWTWTWEEDKSENVRFASPTGAGKGFVRVIETTNMNTAISTVMTAEGLTAASSKQATLGNFPGTEVTASGNRTVWFIPARNRVYALSFTNDSGQFFTDIAASIRIK